VVIWITTFSLTADIFLLPLFFMQVQGHSPTEAGWLLLPVGLGAGLAGPIAGRGYDAFGARWITSAGVVYLAGFTATLALWTIDTSAWVIVPLLFVRGFGSAMVLIPWAAALNEVRANEMARATAILGATRNVAGSLIVAILTTFLMERGDALRENAVRGLEPGSPAFFVAARDALMFTFHEVFLIVATVVMLAIVAALMLRSGRPRIAEAERAPAAEPMLIEGAEALGD